MAAIALIMMNVLLELATITLACHLAILLFQTNSSQMDVSANKIMNAKQIHVEQQVQLKEYVLLIAIQELEDHLVILAIALIILNATHNIALQMDNVCLHAHNLPTDFILMDASVK